MLHDIDDASWTLAALTLVIGTVLWGVLGALAGSWLMTRRRAAGRQRVPVGGGISPSGWHEPPETAAFSPEGWFSQAESFGPHESLHDDLHHGRHDDPHDDLPALTAGAVTVRRDRAHRQLAAGAALGALGLLICTQLAWLTVIPADVLTGDVGAGSFAPLLVSVLVSAAVLVLVAARTLLRCSRWTVALTALTSAWWAWLAGVLVLLSDAVNSLIGRLLPLLHAPASVPLRGEPRAGAYLLTAVGAAGLLWSVLATVHVHRHHRDGQKHHDDGYHPDERISR